jgi:hypothetical protein
MKKAGVVVAVTAASLLAVSPLAFASDPNGRGNDRQDRQDKVVSQVNYAGSDRISEQNGLINVGDVNALNNVNVCPGIPVSAGIGNVLGLLALGAADTDAQNGSIVCVNDNSVTQGNENN